MTASRIAPRERKPLWKAGLVAVLLSGISNAFVYSIAYITGIIPWNMLSPGRGVSLNPGLVVSVSVGGAILGTIIYAMLQMVTDDASRIFRWIALSILLISFAAPFSMERFTTALTITLDFMHVIVAASTIWALTVWRERS